MGCRIGITTNPGARRRHWESQYPTLRNWRIVSRHESKSEAQREENRLARLYGCEAHPGGDGPERAKWCVYMFEY